MLTLIVSILAFLYGPSDRVRTCGLMVPNHPRYQLRYTRIFAILFTFRRFSQTTRATNCATPGYLLFGFWKFHCLWSKLWSNAILRYISMGGQIPQSTAFQGLPAFRFYSARIPARHSQTKRGTSSATPGYLIFLL